MSDKLPDAANLALAGFVFGQFVTDRPFSWSLASVGIALWLGFLAFSFWVVKWTNAK